MRLKISALTFLLCFPSFSEENYFPEVVAGVAVLLALNGYRLGGKSQGHNNVALLAFLGSFYGLYRWVCPIKFLRV